MKQSALRFFLYIPAYFIFTAALISGCAKEAKKNIPAEIPIEEFPDSDSSYFWATMGTPFFTFKSNVSFYCVKKVDMFYIFAEHLAPNVKQQTIEIRFAFKPRTALPRVGKFYIYEMYSLESGVIFGHETYAEIIDKTRNPQHFNTNFDLASNKSYINFTKVEPDKVSGDFSINVPANGTTDGYQPYMSITGRFNNVKYKTEE